MKVFRLASSRFRPDNSEGARIYGGRWNLIGTPALYASSTHSLCALEVIVHHGGIPHDYEVIEIEIPDSLSVETVEPKGLPDNWPDPGSEPETAKLGSEWAESLRTPVLRVPSAVAPDEHNYVLNPAHPDFSKIKFTVSARKVDPRLRR